MNMSRSTLFLVKLALAGLGYGLLGYAASRTLEFVQQTMPPDKQWMGYLFLLATGIGALIWLNVYLHDAKGAKQRGLSFGLAVVDLLMEFVLVYADTIRESSANGLLKMSEADLRLFIMASVGAVGINAIGWFFYKLFDPDKEQERKAADIADNIEDEAMKLLSTPEARKHMIDSHVPAIQAAIMARVTENVASRFSGIPADGTVFAPKSRTYEQTTTVPHPITQPQDEPTYHPIPMQPKPKEDYGPAWKNSTDISSTLDAYAWACLHCQGTNPSHTRHCQWCHRPRTNGSPVTAFSDLPPAKRGNHAVDADDIALAKSINPLAAPYRACPNCGDNVPLTVLTCAECGTKMPALPIQDEASAPRSPFQPE